LGPRDDIVLRGRSETSAAETTAEPVSTKRSLIGLNWLNLLVSAMQAGFGPFLSVYLTAEF